MKDRLKKMICLTLVSCLLAACGATPAADNATGTSESNGSATEQSNELDPTPTSMPEPTPKPEAFTDVQALGDFSEGLAFAKVTLPDGSQEYAYITQDGKIAFTLPEGYVYGWPFHDGYAAVCDIMIDFSHGSSYSSSIKKYDDPERRYNLVDARGNLCFEEGAYCFIGTYSEGKVLTHKIVEDYNGTENVIAFSDLEGNVLWEVDQQKYLELFDNMVHMPWRSYYQDGKVWIFWKQGNTRFDEYGNIVENCGAGWNADPNHTYDWFFTTEKRQISDTNFALATHDLVYQPMTGEEYEIDPLQETYGGIIPSKVPFVNDRMLVRKDTRYEYHDGPDGDKGFYIFDRNGNIIVNNDDLHITHIDYETTGIDGHWIVELENEYYGVLDTDGNLAFEPVEGAIYHMGDGLYYLVGKNEVVDSTGAVQFTMLSGYKFYSSEGSVASPIEPLRFNSPDGHYHDGIATVRDENRDKRFIDRTGRLLINASDFTTVS